MPVFLDRTNIVIVVNQIEVHPYFQQRELQALNAEHGILTQAWSPIGGITSYGEAERRSFDDPVLLEIAAAHEASAAQVMLAWHLQQRSEEHTSELQSRGHLVCRLLLEKKKT